MITAGKPFQLLLLALAGAASFYVAIHFARPSAREPSSVVEAITRERPTTNGSDVMDAKLAEVRDSTLALPQRSRVAPDSKGEAFAKLSWLPPPPPPPPVRVVPPSPPPRPVVPTAPALPFTFVGLLEQRAARPQAFLSKGEVLLVVSSGDLLENNTYRVDTLNAQQIVITYLPLNTPQTLNILGNPK
jgi:hypothetical protein